jgi:hypothetical protein
VKRRKSSRPHGVRKEELQAIRAFAARQRNDPYVPEDTATWVAPPCRCAKWRFAHYHEGQQSFEPTRILHWSSGDEMFAAIRELIEARQMEQRDVAMQWFVAANQEALEQPEWLRSAAIDTRGTIFLSAALAGPEGKVFLVARREHVAYATNQDHLYLPATWLAERFPEISSECRVVAARVRRAAEGRTPPPQPDELREES